MAAQIVCCLADLALARQEDQDVPDVVRVAPELVDSICDGVVQVVITRLFKRPIALLDRKGAARDVDDRRRTVPRCEVRRKAIGVDGRRGHDDFEVGPPRQDLAQIAQQEVDVQRALVRLVDDDRVVGLQQRIGLRFGQQDAVGHQLDRGVAAQSILKTHLEADHVTEWRLQFLRDALGHRAGGDAPRLRVADQLALPRRLVQLATAEQQGNLRQLRGFARTGLSANDDDLVCLDGGGNFVAPGRHRQRFRKLDL